jgi:hypothetical protein
LTLYRITEELVVTKDLDEILDYVMDQIFDIFTPSQATILLRDGEEAPVPGRAAAKRNIRPVSSTIMGRILVVARLY